MDSVRSSSLTQSRPKANATAAMTVNSVIQWMSRIVTGQASLRVKDPVETGRTRDMCRAVNARLFNDSAV
jgi:hypothetical protein